MWVFAVRHISSDDPWEKLPVAPALGQYGPGARLDFAEYLVGESVVKVHSIEEIQEWLRGCEYQSDESLFNERDFWQHPSTFERLRAGDCEDFAIWAWRKLLELGIDANLVAGYSVKNGELDGRHAWVTFTRGGEQYVYEPSWRNVERAIRPLSKARDEYFPQFGVDRHAKRFAYSGYLNVEKKLLARREKDSNEREESEGNTE